MIDNTTPDTPNSENHQDPEKGQVLLYQSDNNGLRLECRFIEEGELQRAATVAKYATVQTVGTQKVERKFESYNLETILEVCRAK